MISMGMAARMYRNGHMQGAFCALVLLGSGGIWSGPARAADDPAAAGVLQEVVVTATRREESLSKVPISVSAFTQESIDIRGIKDFQDVARFTPGVNIDNTGTNNISIRGISSTAGAGTTGIYIDDTPIQMRALAFNPDDALPKTFDVERVEVLRGPQGTLFGAGSEGGTVRYITTQPSLTKSSIYSRSEISYTQGGAPSYEIGVAGGGPLVDGKFGVRATVWYRRDGGWIDHLDPTTLSTLEKDANRTKTVMFRLAAIWAPTDAVTITPSVYFQNLKRNAGSDYWPILSDPGRHVYRNADPSPVADPIDRFVLPALKIDANLGSVRFISNTSYYNRHNVTGYDGTLYNLGFFQTMLDPTVAPLPLLDGSGLHLPPGLTDYRAPASVLNDQKNFVQEFRLQSNDPDARLIWTAGLFFSTAKQKYVERISGLHDEAFFQQLAGSSVGDFFAYCPSYAPDGETCNTDWVPVPLLANGDDYILETHAKDEQIAAYGEATYNITDALKATVGARFSRSKFTNDSYTAGPQLFLSPQTVSTSASENSFTPKVSLAYQLDPGNMFYFTYSKGFRPGGANNPVPQAACEEDFANFHIAGSPAAFKSDTVQSFEVGAKNNIANRVRLASSVYYIKWNNIQQTVIPPICQISWISNLGKAEAKGIDVQADVSLSDAISLQIAAGYTDARYTQDSRLSLDVGPVVAKGDAIMGQSGQPPAPVTASVGAEYRFQLIEHDAFLRLDYQYQGRAKWLGASQDPDTLQYDPANFVLSDTNFFTLRGGVTLGDWQVAAFVDNLTDTRTLTNYNFSIDPGTGDTRLQRVQTFRPRTFGLTFTYRH